MNELIYTLPRSSTNYAVWLQLKLKLLPPLWLLPELLLPPLLLLLNIKTLKFAENKNLL